MKRAIRISGRQLVLRFCSVFFLFSFFSNYSHFNKNIVEQTTLTFNQTSKALPASLLIANPSPKVTDLGFVLTRVNLLESIKTYYATDTSEQLEFLVNAAENRSTFSKYWP